MHQAPLAITLSVLSASIAAFVLAPASSRAADTPVLSTASQDAAVAALMRQAQFLLSHNRPDLARGVLQKVLAVQPDHEAALLTLGELELRSNQNAAAQSLLERLQRTQPNSSVTREMEALWQLYTTDRLRLTQLRQLVAGGKTAQARVLARQLFPGEVPPGTLSGEFSDLLADTPSRRQATAQALAQKVDRGGAPRDRLSMYNLQARDNRTLPSALRGYAQLAQDRSVPPDRLVGPWANALAKARTGQAGREAQVLAREQEPLYSRTMPRDLQIVQANRTREGGSSAPTEPAIQARERGYAALSERKHAEAEAGFQDALRLRPGDASSRAGLGIIRLREGRYAQARQWLDEAAARERDPSARKDWQELAASARYWEQVGRSRELIAAQKLPEADALLVQTLPLAPDQTEATVLLASVRAQQGQTASADALYAKVLAADPAEARAWRGRFALGVRQPSATRSADAWLDEAQTQAQRLKVPAGDLIDTSALRDAADRELAQGRATVALRLLERGVAMQGQDPWLRHDLARLYLRDGLPDLARRVMDEGVAQTPKDPQMRYAAALIALSSDREEDALAHLDGIPAASRDESQATLGATARFELAMRQYREALARGDRDAVQTALQTADRNANGQATRQLRLARAEAGAGQADAARQRLDRLNTGSLPFNDRVEHAELQATVGREAQASSALDALVPDARDTAQAATLVRAQETVASARIDRALVTNQTTQARQVAETAFQAWSATDTNASASPRAQAQARLWLAAGAPDRALAALDTAPSPAADTPEGMASQRTRVQALNATGQRGEARTALAALHRQTVNASVTERLRDVELATDIGEREQAQRWLDPLLSARPTDPEVRLEAARLARLDGRYNDAMAHLRAAGPAQPAATAANAGKPTAVALLEGNKGARPAALAGANTANTSGSTPAVRAAMAALDARRQPRIEAGYMQTQYTGDDGISSMRSREIPIVVTWPVGYQGHVFGQVDAVKLEAGTLAGDYNAIDTFGTVLARPPGTPAAIPRPQNAQGANIGLGWLDDRQRFDIGLIGVGMPVRNWVGGWQRSFTRQQTDIGVEIARRVEARSLLTYVGATDPITGAVWGGVTQTFGALRLSRPLDDTYTLSSRLKIGFYDGQHVQKNSAWQWRSVIDRDFIRSEPLNLNIGVAGMLWQFRRNSNFYTYGHGGYYSPQRYFSLGLPIELTGRRGTWSYLLRATLAHSWTHTDDAAYYPLDPLLQQQAGDPRHSGGKGGGFGGSMRAAIEKRITPQWSLGAWLDLDRSDDYSPTRGMIYLRHFFKPQGSPVPVPPQPVVPYSQF